MDEQRTELRTFAPHPLLAPYVQSYWLFESRSSAPEGVRYLHPDGGHGISLNLGGAEGRCTPFPRGASVTGRLLAPRALSFQGRIRLAGIRLRPEGAFPLFGTAALGEAVFRTGELDDLVDRAESVASPSALPGLFDTWLFGRGRIGRLTPVVVETVRRIRETCGSIHIGSIAMELAVSSRHLERLFRERVGYSPKQLARITRARRAKSALAAGSDSLTEVAFRFGYADQAHLTREFSAIIGIPPAKYLLRRAAIETREDGGIHHEHGNGTFRR